MKFRPCIDIHNGKVKQIVGSTLTGELETNFVAEQSPAFFAAKYREDGLRGGHVIMLDRSEESKKAALEALKAFPGGLHVGGGITEMNAQEFLDAGAAKVIVSSYAFDEGKLDLEKLRNLSEVVGREKLVLDLSCRARGDDYVVVTDKWKTFTDLTINVETFEMLGEFVSEFLIHGVDQEGKQSGIEKRLIKKIAQDCNAPVVYAGGVQGFEDIERISVAGNGKVDFTVGSALDLFGGELGYEEVVKEYKND